MSMAATITETPLKQTKQSTVSLPPLSSILLSPAESSLRHSLIVESTPLSQKAPLLSSRTKPNIFNTSTSTNKPAPAVVRNQHTHRAFSLPSIESLTTSPTLKKSVSYSSALPLPTPYHDSFYNKSFVPVTPLTHKLPLAPILNQSTPLHVSRKSKFLAGNQHNVFPLMSKTTNPNTSIGSEANESSFVSSTPFKSTLNTSTLSSGNDNIFSKNSGSNSSVIKADLSNKSHDQDNANSSNLSKINTSKKRKASVDESKSFAFISHSQETFLSNEPNIDNARLARRKRRRTSPTELAILKDEFKKGTTPNKQRRILIAKKVDMTEKAVQIWFQNRRQAMRKLQSQNSKEFVVEITEKRSLDTSDDDDLNENDDDDHKDVNEQDDDVSISRSSDADSESKLASEGNVSSDDSSVDSKQLNLLEENKENIDPITKSPSKVRSAMSLPPRGIFSSPLSSTKTNKKVVLTDITNQQVGQTFKFKSTNFGLISHSSNTSRRQKPTMKLKLKSGFANSNKSNDFKHQGVVILKDSTNLSNTKTDIKLKENILTKVNTVQQLRSEN